MSEQLYQVREFAQRSGVTIRTLHHYDQIGLLRPSVYTEAGYRLYSDRDFGRLQQIVTLKFIGLSRKRIREILEGDEFDLWSMLNLQRIALQKKRHHLELAIQAIERAERMASPEEEPDWESFQQIIEVVTMESNQDFFKKYYTEEQLAEFKRRRETEGDMIRQTEQDWKELIAEVEGSLDEDPAGEKGQRLAARWDELIERFTKGDPEVIANMKKLYADRENLPENFRMPFNEDVQKFITKAQQARAQRNG